MEQGARSVQKLFQLKTKEGYIFKILSELLSNTLKNASFMFDRSGITLKGVDFKGSVIAYVFLGSEQFLYYQCSSPVHIGINTVHLYRVLKSIKKKDTINMEVHTDRPAELIITVDQNDNCNHITTSIKVIKIPPSDIVLPTGYCTEPLMVQSKDFQRMTKNLTTIGKFLAIHLDPPHSGTFFCDGGELYNRTIRLGPHAPPALHDPSTSSDVVFTATYHTQCITQLMKICNLSTNVLLYNGPNLPLRLRFQLGMLGHLEIYYKSIEDMSIEQDSE